MQSQVHDLDMTTTKYYALAVTISQMVLEVGADMDNIIKTKIMVGVSVVVVVVIVITILLCWCCCSVETDSSNNDINRQDVRTPLIDPRPQLPQRISSQKLTEDSPRAVIKKVEQSGMVVSVQQRIVRVHANLQGVEEVFQTEKELVDKITYLLRNETTSYVDYILQLVQLRLIGVTVGHSVVCHFHCPAADDLKSLKDKLRSRELEKSLDTVFRAALPERHIARVAITSVDKQYADRIVPSSDSSVCCLDRSVSRSVYVADDIETTELYSILEKDLPVQHRAWKSRRPSKKY